MTVVIGIDPHKASHTAAAVGADLAKVGAITAQQPRSPDAESPGSGASTAKSTR